MASTKKKQDEKHLKMLREMVALPHNKQCFDCHQRGPTYINMTIGSYVCTACSGLLRGLNPPHRVKSISMASFTPDEMEFIKSHGNEFCRKVWLGLYDQRQGSQTESRDENKVKDFMTQKYERKRYYVAPTDTMKEEAKRMNESAISKTTGTRPLKSLLGENTPRLQVGAPQGKERSQGTVLPSSSSAISLASASSTVSLGNLFGDQGDQAQGTANSSNRDSALNLGMARQGSSASLPGMLNNATTGESLFGGANEEFNQSSSGQVANQSASEDLFAGTSANQNVENQAIAGQGLFGVSSLNQNPAMSSGADLFGGSSANQITAMPSGADLFVGSSANQITAMSSGADLFGGSSANQITAMSSGADLFGGSSANQNPVMSSGADLFGGSSAIQITALSSGADLFGGSSANQNPVMSSGADLFGGSSANQITALSSGEDLFWGTAASQKPAPVGDNMFGALSTAIPQENKAPVVAATPAPISATPQSPGNASLHSSKSSGSTAMDLLGDLGGDPFASSASQSQAGGGFADFGNFGSTSTSQPPAFSQSTPLQPVGSGGQSTQPAFNGFPPATAPTQPQSNAAPSADKYSNLTDLFSGGTTETSSASNTGWSTSFSTASSVNWGGGGGGPSTSAGGINWGGDGSGGGNSQPSSGGLNWNSSSTSTQQPPAPSSMSGWGSSGAGGNTSASMSWGGVSASTQQANATPNPFGGGAQTTLATQGGAGAGQPNPFGGQPAQGAGSFGAFGAPSTGPQPGGFGQFNTPASTAGVGGQFGQFGAPANTMGGGFGQFNTQNGGFGSGATSSAGFGAAVQTSSHQGFGGAQQQGYGGQQAFGGPPASQPGIPGQFGVQQPAGFGQQQHAGGFGAQPGQMQQQGFGGAPAQSGWGQPAGGPTPNPFMSTAQQYSAPKTGGANPFL